MPDKKTPLEKQIEKKVCDYAIRSGVLVFKFTPAGQRGWPDRLFFYKSRAMFVEFKRPGKLPTVLQSHRLEYLRYFGIPAHWCCYVTTGKFIVDELVNGSTVSGKKK